MDNFCSDPFFGFGPIQGDDEVFIDMELQNDMGRPLQTEDGMQLVDPANILQAAPSNFVQAPTPPTHQQIPLNKGLSTAKIVDMFHKKTKRNEIYHLLRRGKQHVNSSTFVKVEDDMLEILESIQRSNLMLDKTEMISRTLQKLQESKRVKKEIDDAAKNAFDRVDREAGGTRTRKRKRKDTC